MEIKSNIVQLQTFQRSETFLRSLKYIFCISKIKHQYVIKPFNFLPSLKVNWREICNWQENKWNILKEPIWWCRGRQMCQFYICFSKVLVVVFSPSIFQNIFHYLKVSLLDNWIILDKWPSSTLFIKDPLLSPSCDSGSSFVEVSDFFSELIAPDTHTRFQLQLRSFLGRNTPDANLLPLSWTSYRKGRKWKQHWDFHWQYV